MRKPREHKRAAGHCGRKYTPGLKEGYDPESLGWAIGLPGHHYEKYAAVLKLWTRRVVGATTAE
jgi:hypothetical protein